MTKRKKIVPKRRKWETESSREPWRDAEKTKERWGREWNSTKSGKSKKWRLHCSIFARKERLHAEMEDMQLQKQRLKAESKKEDPERNIRIWCRSCCSKLNSNKNINRTQHWKSYSDLVTINAQTTVLCKRNANEIRCFSFFAVAKNRRLKT